MSRISAIARAAHAYIETAKIVYPNEYGGRTIRRVDGDLTLLIFNKHGHIFEDVSLSGEVFQHPTSEYYVGKFEPVNLCDECGRETAVPNGGPCYECQCDLQALGMYNMDGDGMVC